MTSTYEVVLDRAGRLTPGSLRAAIARAVMEVAPKKARKRREEARKDARVERWQEDSGNAALAGFELPPDEALAADQRITWWARELKKAGLEDDMDVLRARAFLDLVLGKDSRPTASADGAAEPTAKPSPEGFAGRATLTVPLATMTGLADRPGDLTGIGPVDPNPGANTVDRYRTWASADPVSSTSTYRTVALRAGNWCASRPLRRGSNWLMDDCQMRAARPPGCLT